jgi:cyclophilin family peptidyl-prolyl cis-trans isomerase
MMENVNKVKSQKGHKGFAFAVRFFRTTLLILLVSIFVFGFNLSMASSMPNEDASEFVLTQASASTILEQPVASHSANQQHCSFQNVCHAPILMEIASFTSLTSFNSLPNDFTANIATKGRTVSVILPPPLA